jgi:hypothetical protein
MARRNAFRGPGHTNVNVSFAKDTHIFENVILQVALRFSF